MTLHHAPEGFTSDGISSRSTKGSIGELIACAELMRRGFHVFRCESPNAPFDLVAYRDGQCQRVEVKTITFTERSDWRIAPSFVWPRNDEWDLLLVVGADADVFVFASGTPQEACAGTIRAHYGFAPRLMSERPRTASGVFA